jgi:hypothetical protein
MRKLLSLLIPCVFLLAGCNSFLDQHYIDELEPFYLQWLYKSYSDESDMWLESNTRKIECDMRKDGYDGLHIRTIRKQAENNAIKSVQWRKKNGINFKF